MISNTALSAVWCYMGSIIVCVVLNSRGQLGVCMSGVAKLVEIYQQFRIAFTLNTEDNTIN